MTTVSVSKKIKSAMADAFLTKREATAIVKEAEKGRVTVGEAKAVADLFDRGTRYDIDPMNPNLGVVPPGMNMTLAIPENPGDVTLEAGAKSILNAFFAKHNVPAGAEKAKIKEQAILRVEGGPSIGPALAKEPKNLKALFPLVISDPLDVARDMPMQTAYIDLKKGTFFLKVEGGFVRDPSPKFYGPLELTPKASKITQARADEIRGKFSDANLAGILNWTYGGVMQNHLGVKFEQVELMRERHPDGYSYTAFVPVGALTPTAGEVDPNTVNEVYVERNGGLAGLKSYVLLNL